MQPLEEKHISNPRKDLLPLRQQALYQGSSERLVLFLVRPRYYPYHHINLMIVPQILSQVPLCHLAGFTTCLDGKERPWKTIFRNHWQPASSTALVHRCRFFFRVQDAQHAHSISSVGVQCVYPHWIQCGYQMSTLPDAKAELLGLCVWWGLDQGAVYICLLQSHCGVSVALSPHGVS